MLKRRINRALRKLGYELRRATHDGIEPSVLDRIDRVQPFSMTSRARLAALGDAVSHVCRSGVDGAIVECGVWKGGSSMMAALTAMDEGDLRDIWLYDTFEGMTAPTGRDRDHLGRSAEALLDVAAPSDRVWANGGEAEPRANMASTGYPPGRLHFVKGRVEDTIPATAPEAIAVLRLDTDWYESTAHELAHLYPRLVSGGLLIIDDYGHYEGARQATDEFIATLDHPLFLWRIDYTGRMAVKP